MPHRECIGSEEFEILAQELWSSKPKLTPEEVNREFRLTRESKEAKIRLINKIDASKLAHAAQIVMPFALPGEDWGSEDRSYKWRKR
jgi:hypothetical protein